MPSTTPSRKVLKKGQTLDVVGPPGLGFAGGRLCGQAHVCNRTKSSTPLSASRNNGDIMLIEVKVPQLSESVAEATLVSLAQEGRRGRRPRRKPDRHRDRQGGARTAGARRGRDRQDHQGQRRAGRIRRSHRPDRYRSEGRGQWRAGGGQGGSRRRQPVAGKSAAAPAAYRPGRAQGAWPRRASMPPTVTGHRPRWACHQGRCAG